MTQSTLLNYQEQNFHLYQGAVPICPTTDYRPDSIRHHVAPSLDFHFHQQPFWGHFSKLTIILGKKLKIISINYFGNKTEIYGIYFSNGSKFWFSCRFGFETLGLGFWVWARNFGFRLGTSGLWLRVWDSGFGLGFTRTLWVNVISRRCPRWIL